MHSAGRDHSLDLLQSCRMDSLVARLVLSTPSLASDDELLGEVSEEKKDLMRKDLEKCRYAPDHTHSPNSLLLSSFHSALYPLTQSPSRPPLPFLLKPSCKQAPISLFLMWNTHTGIRPSLGFNAVMSGFSIQKVGWPHRHARRPQGKLLQGGVRHSTLNTQHSTLNTQH